MGEDSAIEQHLRAGHDRLARIGEAVAAFRRLAPADYGPFLVTIEADLGAIPHELGGGAAMPLLLAGPTEAASQPPSVPSGPTARSGSIREAVLALIADGGPRTTLEIRLELETSRPINRASLHSEIFAMRKLGLLRSEGRGRGTRHMLAARSTTTRAPASKRDPAARPSKRKRDDDDERPAPARAAAAPDAARIYAAAIGGHHLLSKAEELALACQLEEVEITLWKQLLAGPLADEARQLLREGATPVEPADARAARAADLDRQITTRVLAPRQPPAADPLEADRADLRPIAAEVGRIRDRFVTCNLRLVPATIRRHGYHFTTSLAMSDLIQEGNFGLLKAISRFDYRRGLRFSTFATWWIRHYLVRARQNLGAEVRIPVHMHDLAAKVRRAKGQLRKELGRDPTPAELANALKVSPQSLQTLDGDWLKYREALPAFDSVGSSEAGLTPSYLASTDALADEILVRNQEEAQIVAAVACMPPLLATIVRRRFGLGGAEPETLVQIGDTMNLSRERIRQLEQKALAILRQLVEVTGIAA